MSTPAVPTGKGRETDSFNDWLRANPEYRAELQAMGVNPDRPVNLSGPQRSRMEQWVRQRFPTLPGKFQIDPAGNVNTDHGLSTAWSNPYFRTAIIAGAAVGTAGAINPALLGMGGTAAAPTAAAASGSATAVGGAAAGGAGVASTIAGGAAAGGGIWGTISRFAANPLVQQGIESGLGYLNTRAQIDAQNRSAEALERSAREALDFEKGVYADDKAFFEPYGEVGKQSVARLSDMVNQPSRAPLTADQVFASGRGGQPPAPTPQPPQMQPQGPSLSMMLPPEQPPMPPLPTDPEIERMHRRGGPVRPSLAMMRRTA